MAEKRRGLGRGLGSLIPSQEPGRPSDVFFPPSERVGDNEPAAEATEEDQRKAADPAESMRRAQAGRRTPAKKTPVKSTTTRKSASAKPATTKAQPAAKTRSTAKSQTTTKTTPTKGPSAGKAAAATRAKPAPSRGPSDSINKSKETASRAGAVSVDSVEELQKADYSALPKSEASLTVSSVSDGNPDGTETAGDGVYVSRETSRRHPSDEPEAGDAGSVGPDIDHEESVATIDSRPSSTYGGSGSELDNQDDIVSRETVADGEDYEDSDSEDAADEQSGLVPVPGTTFGEIDLDLIRANPRQPREVFDEDALDELVTSIREIGVLQPVVVRRCTDVPGSYELIMGERRFRASKEAGKKTVPAIVRDTADDDLLRDALLENLHRVDLNPLEEAAAYAQLLEDFNCTHEELSARIGRSRPQISNTLRLLKLPPMVQRRVAAGVLSSGHARALLGLSDGANMEVLAQRVVSEGLSVRATEEAVVLLNRGEPARVSRGTTTPNPELAALSRTLGDRLDTRVHVTMGKTKGKIAVEFANGEDLGRILALLGLETEDSI